MKITLAALVVVTTVNSCNLSNVDGAQVLRLEVTDQECALAVEMLDPRRNVRAYCVETEWE